MFSNKHSLSLFLASAFNKKCRNLKFLFHERNTHRKKWTICKRLSVYQSFYLSKYILIVSNSYSSLSPLKWNTIFLFLTASNIERKCTRSSISHHSFVGLHPLHHAAVLQSVYYVLVNKVKVKKMMTCCSAVINNTTNHFSHPNGASAHWIN